jgi:hypothetical protein
MNRTSQALAIGILGMLLGSGSAWAAFPDSVTGTWSAILNQTSTTIVITSQGTTGKCREISGTISTTTNINGFYCPATGRIFFLRKSQATNDTSQAYSGNLASDAGIDRMAGTFADINSNGDFAWSASK